MSFPCVATMTKPCLASMHVAAAGLTPSASSPPNPSPKPSPPAAAATPLPVRSGLLDLPAVNADHSRAWLARPDCPLGRDDMSDVTSDPRLLGWSPLGALADGGVPAVAAEGSGPSVLPVRAASAPPCR